MLKQNLKKNVNDKKQEGVPNFVIRNFLKEYLQYPTLSLIYSLNKYKNFIFTGGSCLRICHNMERLSEDLDFDLSENDFNTLNLSTLAEILKNDFENKYLLQVVTKIQGKTRIYLKFPILKDLGLAKEDESDQLFVKIEPMKSVFENPKLELTPISQYGYNFIVRNYSLKFLMTGKLNAIFTREWFKGNDNEINIKGRDFYDIYWYLKNNIEPDYVNLKRLTGISNKKEMQKALKEKIDKEVTIQKLSYDLENFFPNQVFIKDFCENYKEIMNRYL